MSHPVITLTKYREEAEYTKMELARQANVHPSRITAIELGRAVPRADSVELARLAGALPHFRGDPADLLKPVEEPEPAKTATA